MEILFLIALVIYILYTAKKIDDLEFRVGSCEIYIEDLENRISEIENIYSNDLGGLN